MTKEERTRIAHKYVIRKECERADRLGRKYGLIVAGSCLAWSAFALLTTLCWGM